MDKLIFNAANLVAQQSVNRAMLTNELANLSTTGFKTSFSAAMRSIKAEGPGFDSRFQSQVYAHDLINLKAGSMMITGNPLDVALTDSTVMGVQAPNGELAFTRRGDLRINANGVLQTGSGEIVRGEDGPITLPWALNTPSTRMAASTPVTRPKPVLKRVNKLARFCCATPARRHCFAAKMAFIVLKANPRAPILLPQTSNLAWCLKPLRAAT
jgi:flagellar hook-basal body protein